MAVSSEVVDYIKAQLKAGYAISQIKESLKREGWPDGLIYEAVGMAQESISPEELPEVSPIGGKKEVMGIVGFSLAIAVAAMILKDVVISPLGRIISLYIYDFSLNLGLQASEIQIIYGVLGLGILVGAFIMYYLKKEVLAGLLVIIMSAVYLISGGMLVVFLLGIIGGGLLMVKK